MINISSIGIGCHKLQGGFEKNRSKKIISAALDSNINYFDTGDIWANEVDDVVAGMVMTERCTPLL